MKRKLLTVPERLWEEAMRCTGGDGELAEWVLGVALRECQEELGRALREVSRKQELGTEGPK